MGGVVVGVYMGVVMAGDVVSVGRVECGECRVTHVGGKGDCGRRKQFGHGVWWLGMW